MVKLSQEVQTLSHWDASIYFDPFFLCIFNIFMMICKSTQSNNQTLWIRKHCNGHRHVEKYFFCALWLWYHVVSFFCQRSTVLVVASLWEKKWRTTEFAKHTALTSASDDSYNMVSLDFSLFFKSVTSFFRKQMDLRYTQPNHQHKCWFCTFLQTMNMLKLYSFLGSVFNFMLHFICAYALVTFRHKSHLVRVGKRSYFGL